MKRRDLKSIKECIRDDLDKVFFLKKNYLRGKLSELGLYVGQPKVLTILNEKPGITQKELAEEADIKTSTLNVMLNRLAKNDFVEIKQDKENLKITRVYLKEKGKEKQEKAQSFLKIVEERQFEGFSEKEKEECKKYLERMQINIENLLKEEKGDSYESKDD